MTFRVLYVCTGNICRSPLAEQLFETRLPAGSDVLVSSAGVRAVVGHGLEVAAEAVARELGVRVRPHEARRVNAALVTGSDLVLTATTVHRDELMRLAPAAFRRTFTMREFVRLGATLPAGVGDPAARVARVAAQRGQVDPPAPGADDIGDPFAAGMEVMRACGAEVAATVDRTLDVLGLTGAAPS